MFKRFFIIFMQRLHHPNLLVAWIREIRLYSHPHRGLKLIERYWKIRLIRIALTLVILMADYLVLDGSVIFFLNVLCWGTLGIFVPRVRVTLRLPVPGWLWGLLLIWIVGGFIKRIESLCHIEFISIALIIGWRGSSGIFNLRLQLSMLNLVILKIFYWVRPLMWYNYVLTEGHRIIVHLVIIVIWGILIKLIMDLRIM